MPADVLSDLLRAVRLRGALFYDVEASHPWVAEARPASELLPEAIPGAEHLIEFHGVVRGACWAAMDGHPPVRLEAGDVVLFPRGDAHVMSSAPGLRAPDAATHVAPPPPGPPPWPVTVDAAGQARVRLEGGTGATTRVICGFLGCDARPFNPLLEALPRLLVLEGAAEEGSWVSSLLTTAVRESSRRRPGSEAVLERMSEMLFLEALRRHVEGLPEDRTGWLAGLRDPVVGAVLARLHGRPAEPWTLDALADDARVSRSTLHERFTQLVGIPPIQYLAQWRMQLAARRLRDTAAKVAAVAQDVGYESEAAFTRAFKRLVGVTPGAWRRNGNVSEA
ncbi:MAG: AraC family transcriptional regulator [Planctomycetota bacterium]